jgi:hypothetical protein
MINNLVNKIIPFFILLLGVYLLLRIVPRTKLDERDSIIIALVIAICYLVFDAYLSSPKEHLEATSEFPIAPANPFPSIMTPTIVVNTPAPAPAPTPAPAPAPAPAATLPAVEECNSCKVDIKNNQDVKPTSNDEGNNAYIYQPTHKYESNGSRMKDGIMANEMPYTDYNTLPIGANINSKVDDFSYSFLPPDKWYPIPPHPPVCVAEKQCPVCPTLSSSSVAELKDWGEATRITPGDQINTTFINDKINSGR